LITMCLYETDTDVKDNSKILFTSPTISFEHNAVHFEMYTLP